MEHHEKGYLGVVLNEIWGGRGVNHTKRNHILDPQSTSKDQARIKMKKMGVFA